MSQHWKADNRAGGISISILGMHVETEYFHIIFKNKKQNNLEIHLKKFRFDPFSCKEWKKILHEYQEALQRTLSTEYI